MKFPVPTNGSMICTPVSDRRPGRTRFPRCVATLFHHEINDRLRCVDDAVCVCDILGEPLKELLIKCVEEVLFLGEVFTEVRCLFYSHIEWVQRFEELLATERLPDEFVNDVFDLACDDVSAGEGGVIKDGAEDAFGEDVLDEHLLDGIL